MWSYSNAIMTGRTRLVYGALLAVWALIVAWQIGEHSRVRKSAENALINRSRDITTTLGLVIRSQRRWGGVSQERVESALKELVNSKQLSSVALLNAAGEIVASAGPPLDIDAKGSIQAGDFWDRERVTVVNLVDLGATVTREGETNRPPIIVFPRRDTNDPTFTNIFSQRRDFIGPVQEDRFRPPRFEPGTNEPGSTNSGFARREFPPPGPPPSRDDERFRPRLEGTNLAAGSNAMAELSGTNNLPRRPPGGPRGGRPPWMSEEEYRSLLEKRGLHGLVIAMSTESFHRACGHDLWLRCVIGLFAAISVVGLGLAWRNVGKSSELQMRLLRASELNSHLKEMNLAAAGLAHETRNPLNIIRGLAQMVSKEQNTAPEVRKKLRDIVDETDRVTAQLNEFINYSRPREVRRAPVALGSVIAEVVRTLNYDMEEKQIQLQVSGDQLTVEADEQLLRQSLFNLLLNAIQAVSAGGEIQVAAIRGDNSEASLEVRDNGPGVPEHQRTEIFKPYFTTHEKGTGLGLAVVQQIVLAHGWEIECLANQPKGALFRLTHLKVAARN